MASVIEFSDECLELAQSVKKGKTSHAIFTIDDTNSCTISHTSSLKMSCEEQWNEFASNLPKGSCAYGISAFNYISPADGVKRSKTVFLLWAPSDAPTKAKMMVAFSVKGITSKIGGGLGCKFQAEGTEELEYEEVMKKVLARSTVK